MFHSKPRYSKVADLLFMLLFPRIWVGQVMNIHTKKTFINASHPKTFPLHLVRVVALIISLLFSYLTATPAFGQEPVGLGEVQVSNHKKSKVYTFPRPSSNSKYLGENVSEDFYTHKHDIINWATKETYQESFVNHRDKLIILDFWASWCTACLFSLKEMHENIIPYIDTSKVIIIPVNYQDYNSIKSTLNNFKWNYQTVYDDKFLDYIFPHNSLPHMVWIKDGKIIATPKSSYATLENIEYVLQGQMPNLINQTQVKRINPVVPLFTSNNANAPVFMNYDNFKLAGFVKDHASEDILVTETPDSLFFYAINQHIDMMLYMAFEKYISKRFTRINGIQYEVDEASLQKLRKGRPKAVYSDYHQDLLNQQWYEDNVYSFELRVPKSVGVGGGMDIIRQKLTNYIKENFNLECLIVNSPSYTVPILHCTGKLEKTLKLLKDPKNLSINNPKRISFSGQYGSLYGLNSLVNIALTNDKSVKVDLTQLEDRTGIDKDEMVSYDIPSFQFYSITMKSIQKELSRYNMKLSIENISFPMLLIRNI